MTILRIALVGNYNSTVTAHIAIPRALDFAAEAVGYNVIPEWIATERLAQDWEPQLEPYHAIWCVPGSPYASMEGALHAIQFAREQRRPFLGTCGGFQHALLEYARNVLGLAAADHAESNPEAEMAFISPLACTLVETRGQIYLQPGTRIQRIYQQNTITEGYNCRYGVNPNYQPLLEDGSLRVTATGEEGEVRVVELANHPFFIATLFQPERSALVGVTHPLIVALLQAANERYT
jgi:CTP synthase (UTP-ammonia lyase)